MSIGLTVVAVAAIACSGGDVDHEVGTHQCVVQTSDSAHWARLQATLSHNDQRKCPLGIRIKQPMSSAARGVQDTVGISSGDILELMFVQVFNRTGGHSGSLAEDDFEREADRWTADVVYNWTAGLPDTVVGARGADRADATVRTRHYQVAVGHLFLSYKVIGVGGPQAAVAGPAHVNGMGTCEYEASIDPGLGTASWSWYLNGEPATEGIGNPYTPFLSGNGQYQLQARGVDEDGFVYWGEYWITMDENGESCPW